MEELGNHEFPSSPVAGENPRRLRNATLSALCLLLVLALLILESARHEAAPAPELRPEMFATALAMPSRMPTKMMFPEDWLAQLPFSETDYAEYAAGLPADTPCASWQNGGISWWDRSAVDWDRAPAHIAEYPFEREGWDALVAFPQYRFCGFPAPYPEKPPPAGDAP